MNSAIFVSLVRQSDKEDGIASAVDAVRRKQVSPFVYMRLLDAFRKIPSTPFAYWAADAVLECFSAHENFAVGGRLALQGASTCDDFRYVRAWYEKSVEPSAAQRREMTWVSFARGGHSRRFYQPVAAVVPWDSERTSFFGFVGRAGRWNPKPVSADHYFAPALTWPLRGVSFTSSALPAGCAYSVGGKVALAPLDQLPSLLAVFNSTIFRSCMSVFAGKVGGFQYETGIVNSTPVPKIPAGEAVILARLARTGWSLQRSRDTADEASPAFATPAILQVDGRDCTERTAEWAKRVASAERAVDDLLADIDEMCFGLYGIAPEARDSITEGAGFVSDYDSVVVGDADANGEDDVEVARAEPFGLAAGLVSWTLGVAVGRFDVRLATGEREWPAEPEPFDPLPICSAGMLTGDDGRPLSRPPAGYPLEQSPILVADRGHRLDITSRVRAVFDVVFGGDADRWWTDVGAALGARSGEVEAWLGRGFFDYHLKTYLRSRRKAPILWPIGTRSGSYLVWLYAHRVSQDTLFQVLNDLVDPKVTLEEQQLTRLGQEAGPDPTASQRRALGTQEGFVSELRELREVIEGVAPLWVPELDDGIAIVLAPLWRLFAHHRAWSKELKTHWDQLTSGEYDWARLAMRLWPERVIPKCAEDRSIAIAHGFEEVFWCQDDTNDDKWHPRVHPTTSIDELVAQRQNPAVAAALDHLAST